MPLTPGSGRTQRRHALNCRIDGVEAIVRDDLVLMCRVRVLLENVVMVLGSVLRNLRLQLRDFNSGTFFRYPTRHGFHEDIRADAGRHIPIEPNVNTAECVMHSLRRM